jgi:hypothetical protein
LGRCLEKWILLCKRVDRKGKPGGRTKWVEKGNIGKVFDKMLQRSVWCESSSVELSQGTARVSIAHTGCAAIRKGKTKIRRALADLL